MKMGRRMVVRRSTLPVVVAAGLLVGLPEGAAADPLREAAEVIMSGAAERGQWHNPLMPAASADGTVRSGDAMLNDEVRRFTRAVLDRGGWDNPHAPSPGYDSGNVLLAVLPGAGVTFGE